MTVIKLGGSAPAGQAGFRPTPSSACCLWTAGVLIWGLVIYIMTIPSNGADGHLSPADEKLMSMATNIKEQKASLSKQMDDVLTKLSQQKEALLEKTLPSVSLLGVVGKGHHEEEMAKLTTEHKEELAKLQDEHSKLKDQRESEVTELQASIEQSKAELKKIKEGILALTVDPAKFCAECMFDYNGLRTSCGSRRDFLMGRHGDTLEVAEEAVVKWDANCLKKDRRQRP